MTAPNSNYQQEPEQPAQIVQNQENENQQLDDDPESPPPTHVVRYEQKSPPIPRINLDVHEYVAPLQKNNNIM